MGEMGACVSKDRLVIVSDRERTGDSAHEG